MLNETGDVLDLTPYGTYTFAYFFGFNSTGKIQDASELILPSTILTDYCYEDMFINCSQLVTAPSSLPNSTLADHCYFSMFWGCSALTSAPTLLSITMSTYCYMRMFQGCTALTTPPVLNSTNLADFCYFAMFLGCTSLTSIPELPATTLKTYCYNSMFENCSSIKLSETQTGEYTNAYTFGATPSSSYATNMFTGTGGTFTGNPTSQTYYTSNSIIS